MKKQAIVVTVLFLAIAICMITSLAKAQDQYQLQVHATDAGLTSVTFLADYTSGGIIYVNNPHSTPWNVYADAGTTATIHDAPDYVPSSSGQDGVRWRYLNPTLPKTVTMDGSHTITLSYRRQVQITLSVTPVGSGTITYWSPSTTNIEGTKWYDAYNQIYMIQANANSGYTFKEWTANNMLIDIYDSNSASTQFTAGGPSAGPGEITAVFVPELVVPEVPFGTVMASISMIVALAAFAGFKRYRIELRPR